MGRDTGSFDRCIYISPRYTVILSHPLNSWRSHVISGWRCRFRIGQTLPCGFLHAVMYSIVSAVLLCLYFLSSQVVRLVRRVSLFGLGSEALRIHIAMPPLAVCRIAKVRNPQDRISGFALRWIGSSTQRKTTNQMHANWILH